MQHQIRSKTNFVLEVISQYEKDIIKTESSIVSTNDIVATVGLRYNGTASVKWVVRRSLLFGKEWMVQVWKDDISNYHLKYAIRDEIQCDWWLKNWVRNKIQFEIAEREEAMCRQQLAKREGMHGLP